MPSYRVTMISGDKFTVYADSKEDAERKARRLIDKRIKQEGKFRHGGFEGMVKSVREK